MIFDYSGYGESSGIPSETQFYHDADSMVDLLVNSYNYKTTDIIAYGESLGGPVACYIAQKHNLPILILDSPLPSVNSLAKRILRPFYIGNILSSILTYPFYEFNTEINLENYKGKSLLIHSIEDEVIPYDIIDKLVKLSTKHIKTIGKHDMPLIPYDEIKTFISSCLMNYDDTTLAPIDEAPTS